MWKSFWKTFVKILFSFVTLPVFLTNFSKYCTSVTKYFIQSYFTCKLSICYQQFFLLYVLANSRGPVSDSIIQLLRVPLDLFLKDALSSLGQFLEIESPLKMMKNPFYFILKLFSFSSYLNFWLEFLAIS